MMMMMMVTRIMIMVMNLKGDTVKCVFNQSQTSREYYFMKIRSEAVHIIGCIDHSGKSSVCVVNVNTVLVLSAVLYEFLSSQP